MRGSSIHAAAQEKVLLVQLCDIQHAFIACSKPCEYDRADDSSGGIWCGFMEEFVFSNDLSSDEQQLIMPQQSTERPDITKYQGIWLAWAVIVVCGLPGCASDSSAHLLLVHAHSLHMRICVQGVAGKVSKTSGTAEEAFVGISAVGTTSASFPTIIGADGPELTQVSSKTNM
jgi:hypothetical protein